MKKPTVFTFPGNRIDTPLIKENDHVGFALIEIGCKPSKKRSALKDKREVLYNYWGSEYRKKGIDWIPQIFRVIAHYDPSRNEARAYNKKVKVDHAIFCEYIPQSFLEDLQKKDLINIFKIINSNTKKREVLEDIILYNTNAQKLHELIVHSGDKPEYSDLRGKMAEILIQKAIEKAKPQDMQIYRNGTIKHFTKKFEKYNNGTEIDAISIFYSTQTYLSLINNLSKMDHLVVKEDSFWKKK